MKSDGKGQGEPQTRILQEYIFNLEEMQEKAEEISIANEKLKQSEDFLMAVLRSTPHGMCLIKNGRNVRPRKKGDRYPQDARQKPSSCCG